MKKICTLLVFCICALTSNAASILIPMDGTQTNHLKAYGIAWHVLDHNTDVKWLLNYRGGSYLFPYSKEDEQMCIEKGVSFETLPDVMAKSVLNEVEKGANNTASVDMQRAPKIAVYAPTHAEGWDDAVVNVLNYAEIPYDVIYDAEVLNGVLKNYDWLHLHHEDFTGQHGRFGYGFQNTPWYKAEVSTDSLCAAKFGYPKVADLKLAVAQQMKTFVANGGFLFAMCSATETFDIALAADGMDITSFTIDGDPFDPEWKSKMKYDQCLAFTGFDLYMTGFNQSNIDTYGTRMSRGVTEPKDYFTLNEFPVLTNREQAMLVQNHTQTIHGFWGATTAFDPAFIKKGVDILATNTAVGEVRYLHGDLGKGMWTFYGGHDPEDYQHRVGEAAPDLSKYPNSPGYRLILNNVLFQSTRTEEETHTAFSAFPNPANSSATLSYTLSNDAEGTLTILDADGKRIYEKDLPAHSTGTVVDVSEFANGTYIWNVVSAGSTLYSGRLSVVH